MNYKRIHDEIINNAKVLEHIRLQERKQKINYYEKHHIIPKCMNGSDDKDNLILLTAREHFLIHWLLVEIYPENDKLSYAFWGMCKLKNPTQFRYTPSSRIYEYGKLLVITNQRKRPGSNLGKSMSDAQKEKLRNINLGKKHSVETKLKMSAYFKLKIQNNPSLRKNLDNTGKLHSIETKKKMSASQKGRIVSEETKIKLREIGKRQIPTIHTKETKKKISEAWQRRPVLCCIYCNKESKNTSSMLRWHFDNCKFKK